MFINKKSLSVYFKKTQSLCLITPLFRYSGICQYYHFLFKKKFIAVVLVISCCFFYGMKGDHDKTNINNYFSADQLKKFPHRYWFDHSHYSKILKIQSFSKDFDQFLISLDHYQSVSENLKRYFYDQSLISDDVLFQLSAQLMCELVEDHCSIIVDSLDHLDQSYEYYKIEFKLSSNMGSHKQLQNKYFAINVPTTLDNVEFFLRSHPIDHHLSFHGQIVRLLGSDNDYFVHLKRLVEALNRYNKFLSKNVYSEYKQESRGMEYGFGINIDIIDDRLTIVNVLDDSPAQKAGLKPGDNIIKINNQWTYGLGYPQLVEMLSENQSIQLKVVNSFTDLGYRHIDLAAKSLTISSVQISLVGSLLSSFSGNRLSRFDNNSLVVDQKDHDHRDILLIKISSFNQGISKEISTKFDNFLKNNSDLNLSGIILDLRDNSGGLLESAVDVADLFLNKGFIASLTTLNGMLPRYFAKPQTLVDPSIPMVTLVNQNTASSAEIVAGALRENHRAIIFGTPTYGKTSVQSLIELNDGYGLKLTVGYYDTKKFNNTLKKSIYNNLRLMPDLLAIRIPLDDFDQLSEGSPVINFKNKSDDHQLVTTSVFNGLKRLIDLDTGIAGDRLDSSLVGASYHNLNLNNLDRIKQFFYFIDNQSLVNNYGTENGTEENTDPLIIFSKNFLLSIKKFDMSPIDKPDFNILSRLLASKAKIKLSAKAYNLEDIGDKNHRFTQGEYDKTLKFLKSSKYSYYRYLDDFGKKLNTNKIGLIELLENKNINWSNNHTFNYLGDSKGIFDHSNTVSIRIITDNNQQNIDYHVVSGNDLDVVLEITNHDHTSLKNLSLLIAQGDGYDQEDGLNDHELLIGELQGNSTKYINLSLKVPNNHQDKILSMIFLAVINHIHPVSEAMMVNWKITDREFADIDVKLQYHKNLSDNQSLDLISLSPGETRKALLNITNKSQVGIDLSSIKIFSLGGKQLNIFNGEENIKNVYLQPNSQLQLKYYLKANQQIKNTLIPIGIKVQSNGLDINNYHYVLISADPGKLKSPKES